MAAQRLNGYRTNSRANCWEVIHCGRENGGVNCATLGPCPAATESRLDGINCGKNGGRACWTVPGTQINWGEPSSGVAKTLGCLTCSFMRRVEEEEGTEFSFLTEATERLGLLTSSGDPLSPGKRKRGWEI